MGSHKQVGRAKLRYWPSYDQSFRRTKARKEGVGAGIDCSVLRNGRKEEGGRVSTPTRWPEVGLRERDLSPRPGVNMSSLLHLLIFSTKRLVYNKVILNSIDNKCKGQDYNPRLSLIPLKEFISSTMSSSSSPHPCIPYPPFTPWPPLPHVSPYTGTYPLSGACSAGYLQQPQLGYSECRGHHIKPKQLQLKKVLPWLRLFLAVVINHQCLSLVRILCSCFLLIPPSPLVFFFAFSYINSKSSDCFQMSCLTSSYFFPLMIWIYSNKYAHTYTLRIFISVLLILTLHCKFA